MIPPADNAFANGLELSIHEFHGASFAFPNPIHNMQLRIFELFARMITNVPAQCIFKAVDIECQMLKSDVEHNRLPLPEDAFSIFYFRDFVQAAKLGRRLSRCMPLPLNHIDFFKETIIRLVEADELPRSAMEQFDSAFVSDGP